MSTFLENRQRVSDPSAPLLLLEITSPVFSGPLHAASDTSDVISNGITYIGVGFEFTIPDDQPGQPARSALRMINVGTGITDELERWQPGVPIHAVLRLVDRDTPDVIEREWPLPLESVSVNSTTVTARLGVDTIERQQAVRLRFVPHLTPGVFSQ